MPSIIDLPPELILDIAKDLSLKTAVMFSCAHRKFHDILNDTRLAPRFPLRTLATTQTERVFGFLDPKSKSYEPSVHAAFEHHSYKDCLGLYQEKNSVWVATMIFDGIVQGHEAALECFIELWPTSLESALVGAASGGHIAMVERLIQERADINAVGPEDMFCDRSATKLECLINPKGWPGADWLSREASLSRGTWHYRDVGRRLSLTPIAWAAANGHLEVVKLLIENEARIDVRDQFGLTPFCWAANQGRLDVVSYMLSISSPDQAQHMGLEALEWAGARDQTNVIRYLWTFLDPKPRPTPENAKYLLEAATTSRNIKLLSRLFNDGFGGCYRTGPFRDFRDRLCDTAIHNHDISILKLLLDKISYNHEDLLRSAIHAGHESTFSHVVDLVGVSWLRPDFLCDAAPCEPIFRKLCSAGISPAGIDHDTLMREVPEWIRKGLIHAVKAILPDIGLDLVTHLAKDVLERAIQGGRLMFELLLSQNLWDQQLSHDGPESGMAIPLAVIKGDVGILKTLFERGFPYTSEDDLILKAAQNVWRGSVSDEISDYLLERKPGVLYELNSEGESVLFRLMSLKNVVAEDAVQLLLDHGADPLQQHQNGKTPLNEAARNSCQLKCFRLMVIFLEQRKEWSVFEKQVAWLLKIMRKTAEEFLLEVHRRNE
jgi:ankyrin repeat protein